MSLALRWIRKAHAELFRAGCTVPALEKKEYAPNATISMFEAKEDRVTVLWTEGLQSLPADYAAK